VNSLSTKKSRHPPQRTCLACHRKAAKRELLRLGRDRTGRVLIDQQQRLAGRGAYVCPTPECGELLFKKKALAHGFRAQILKEDYSAVLEFIQKNVSAGVDQSARLGEASA
jgi:predicted RNA-binding protein YlxR (DUF448 family)